jgi:hypothetical protein
MTSDNDNQNSEYNIPLSIIVIVSPIPRGSSPNLGGIFFKRPSKIRKTKKRS